jgi:hypothetical protein
VALKLREEQQPNGTVALLSNGVNVPTAISLLKQALYMVRLLAVNRSQEATAFDMLAVHDFLQNEVELFYREKEDAARRRRSG